MSFSVSGLGSGLDIDSIVSQLVAVKQSSLLSPLQTKLNSLNTKNDAVSSLKTKYSALQSALQTFTRSIYNSSNDMWSKSLVTSSNEAYATASATGTVSASNIELIVDQIATATTATSTSGIGNIDKETFLNTKFSDIANSQGKEGTFSMFLDGKQYQIEIDENDTLNDIIGKISEASEGKIVADIDESGIFSITAQDESSTLKLGSNGDTSNFESILKLYKENGTHGFSSEYAISNVKTDENIFDSEKSGIIGLRFFDEEGNDAESGTITINGVDIKVDKDMSLNDLISKINNTKDVNVKASYDSLTNKITLTSTQTGENNIALAEEGTNLLNVLHLTEGDGKDEKIASGSQVLGQNAIVTINGNRIVSASNTITGESSGIKNLSITVKQPTDKDASKENAVTKIDLSIEKDNSDVVDAVEKFVKAYNDVVTSTKNATASGGSIGYDSSLNSILTSIRSVTSNVFNTDGTFNMLNQIGISTTKDNTTELTFDKEKFEEALSKDPEGVKLMLSDGATNKSDTGLFDNLLNRVNNILDLENGYFAIRSESFDSQVKSLNTRISRANDQLLKYQERLTKQFNRMDSLIASLNSQLSTFSSYLG